MRQEPTTSSARMECQVLVAEWDDCRVRGDCQTPEITTLPTAKQVTINGRTKCKARVNKWENYWYRVDATQDMYLKCSENYWLFGEFIDAGNVEVRAEVAAQPNRPAELPEIVSGGLNNFNAGCFSYSESDPNCDDCLGGSARFERNGTFRIKQNCECGSITGTWKLEKGIVKGSGYYVNSCTGKKSTSASNRVLIQIYRNNQGKIMIRTQNKYEQSESGQLYLLPLR